MLLPNHNLGKSETSALQFGDKLAPDYLSTLQKRKGQIEFAAENQP